MRRFCKKSSGRGRASRYIAYRLKDGFNDTLAAGAVHGTNANPGPGGARTVLDTESKLSITGGALSFGGGRASADWGDPSLWYPAVTKTAGLMILSKSTPASAVKEIAFGFDNQASGSTYIDKGLQFRETGSLNFVRTSAVATCLVGAYSAGVVYQFMTVLRASGGMSFVKGGAYTNWTLLYIDDTANMNASVYPAVVSKSMVGTVDYVRIPQTLWLPSPLASDSFNRDNGAIGTTDGAGHAESTGLGAGGSGLAWTGATWTIASNVALNTPATFGSELVTNGNMETGDPPTGWNDLGDGSLDGVADERTGGAGAQSMECTKGTEIDVSSRTITVPAGTWVKLDGYLKIGTCTSVKIEIYGSTTELSMTTSSASWVLVRGTCRITAANPAVFLAVIGSAGQTGRFDDISVKALTLSELFSSVVASTQDVIATVNVTAPNNHNAGLVLNLDSTSSPANFVIAYLNRTLGTAVLAKCLAGTYTTLISASVTYSAGAPLRVMKKGLSYELYYNNLRVGTGWTANAVTDANIVSNTKHGLFSTDSSNTFDSFTVYDSGSASGAYEILNNF